MLRLCIALFAVAEGWLLIDIGWFVLCLNNFPNFFSKLVITVLLHFTFLSYLFSLLCRAGSSVPRKGFDSSVIMPFFLVCCDTSYIVSIHIHMSSLHIYTSVVLQTFMVGAASQSGDADFSRAPGLTSGLQGSVNVHHGALLLVPQWQCISPFVFYICNPALIVWK